ncbi:hypothetical protein [Nocardioides sp.]|uniref:hypothetical protein n=1 Tax=Nocardioides sp. TaxID=35761 RepID=UPI00273280AF|nr:hypothetical protein [Nocardioides sp.]MDP3890318.1 hypothetical protein [Nocardioides sp.]
MGRRPARRSTVPAAIALLALVLVGCAEPSAPESAPDDAAPSTSTDAPAADPTDPTEPTELETLDEGELGALADLAEKYAAQSRGNELPEDTAGPDRRVFGADVGWPQCPPGTGIPEKQGSGQPMPTDAAEFVIIGLTNSPSFTVNPCLESQLGWVRDRGLMGAAYAVVSYPSRAEVDRHGTTGPYDGGSRLGALRNVGYQAARFNVATMATTGFTSPIVWVDVEPVASFEWSDDPQANAAVVEGTVRGYRDAGLRVGVYSTPAMWSAIVGGLSFGVPEWRAAGPTSMENALRRCEEDWSIQGGPAILGQWVEDNRDRNVTCPGQGVGLGRWFHQY